MKKKIGRGGKGRKKAAARLRSSEAAGLPSQQGANEVYVDKKVLACFFSYREPTSWIEIDPHYSTSGNVENRHDSNCFQVDLKPELNSPPLHLSKLITYGSVVFESKLYVIGGEYYDCFLSDDDDDIIFSGKMFVHHLLANKWDESPFELNIPRSHPTVVVAEKVIYVFGGFTDNGFTDDGRKNKNKRITNKEHWIECFNLVDYNKDDAKWEFLGPDSAPPDALLEYYHPMYHFVYERGSQIVFFMREAGFYSFNYISKTWAPFRCNLSEEARVHCSKAVVIDHLLFWHFLGVIYAYDLMNDRLVLEQCLDQVKVDFATPPPFSFFCPTPTFLERVGNDALILVVKDCSADDREKGLHLYKFQIQHLTPEPHADHNLRLLQIGCGVFPKPGDIIKNVLAV